MSACLLNLVADINHLERIQRLATRLVTSMRYSFPPPSKRDCSDWAFIPCSGDNFGMTSLPPSIYSRAFWILIRTCFTTLTENFDPLLRRWLAPWSTLKVCPLRPRRAGGRKNKFGSISKRPLNILKAAMRSSRSCRRCKE